MSVSSRQPEGYGDVSSPFALDDRDFRALAYRLVDTMGAYLEALPENPVYRPLPGEVRRQFEEMKLPAEGIRPEEILEFFTERVLPYGRGQNHPCFAAFVDPAASKLSMLAAFASAVTNTSGAGGEYAAIYLEQLAVRWLMELIGFPREGSDGVLLGGGSDANRHCMEVARHWGAQINGWDIREEGLHGRPRLTMYMSAEGHSCLEKAAFTLGLGSPRKVAVDRDIEAGIAFLIEVRAMGLRLADGDVALAHEALVADMDIVAIDLALDAEPDPVGRFIARGNVDLERARLGTERFSDGMRQFGFGSGREPKQMV